MIRARQALSHSPLAVTSCIACAAAIFVLHQTNTKLLTPKMDFGARTFFCNHLPLVIPVLGQATPARVQLAALLTRIVKDGPQGWPALGFDGDMCFDDDAVFKAIDTARRADGMRSRTWLTRQFLKGVGARPISYAGTVLFQLQTFAARPFPDIDIPQMAGTVPKDTWGRLKPFAALAHVSRQDLVQTVYPRPVFGSPWLAAFSKAALSISGQVFEAIVALGAALALFRLSTVRNSFSLTVERIVLAAAAFTLAFVLTTAMSHSFDISRYAVSIMPFSLFSLLVSLVYIPYFFLAQRRLRQERSVRRCGSSR